MVELYRLGGRCAAVETAAQAKRRGGNLMGVGNRAALEVFAANVFVMILQK